MVEQICWWCCHASPTDQQLYNMPLKYDSKLDQFTTMGQFCTWSCMKSYAINRCRIESGRVVNNITLMRLKSEGKISRTRCAPHQALLDKFGGDMTIEEFRKGCDSIVITQMPDEVKRTVVGLKATFQRPSADATGPSAPLRVKRKKPLKTQGGSLQLKITKKEPSGPVGPLYRPMSPY